LRRKIAGWSAAATAAALVTFGAIMAFTLYSEQVEVIDDRLATSANLLASRPPTASPIDVATLEALTVAPNHRRQANTALYGFVLVRTADGSVLQSSPGGLGNSVGPWPPPQRHFNRRADGTRVRFGAFPMGATTVLLAASLEPADESVQDLLEAALIAIPAVLLVVAAGSWWIARGALQPITAITRAATAINATNLGARLPTAAADDEIAAHVRVLNEMFDRLQRSFVQTTRFTADAAHELRTPLTILRGQIEEALRGAPSPPVEQLLLGLLEETSGLQKIADNLLLLSQFDSGKTQLRRERVDFSAVIADVAEDAELLAARLAIAVTQAIKTEVRVDGDATMLRRVALNLVDNAVKYNRRDGRVRIHLEVRDGRAVLDVANTGCPIPPERRAGLFERFYRGDAGRNRETGGSGLGLSLCREIISAHSGTIELSRSETDETVFTVSLPLSTKAIGQITAQRQPSPGVRSAGRGDGPA
jgi:signal transduction histidine kinase